VQLCDSRVDQFSQLPYSMLSISDLDAHRHAILGLFTLSITEEDVVAAVWDMKTFPVNLHDVDVKIVCKRHNEAVNASCFLQQSAKAIDVATAMAHTQKGNSEVCTATDNASRISDGRILALTKGHNHVNHAVV
jgi:hypothetical protein